MGRRPGWRGRSWRARLGWRLLGSALIVVSVALPALALAAGDLNVVAGWANILALPVSALGLVLVFADRARAGGPADVVDVRRPWMAPPLDRMVERPELGGQLVAALTVPGPALAGLTTSLHGAGGFGKTTLAIWACHQPEISGRFPGGLLWVTVGQEVRGADLAVRINDLACALSGQRPAFSDPDAAGAELGRLLDQREPVLLIIDDVWEEAQLRPFRFGGQACSRLVTTRVPGLLSGGGSRIAVDEMSADQARKLVAGELAGLPAEAADQLARLAGRWPVLLNLINGVLRRRVAHGQPPQRAAEEMARQLAVEGPSAFDPARPADRSRAVAATVQASLALLDPADRERYLDLAIFPEDVDIPLAVLALLWPGCRIHALSEELAGLGLVADYRLDPPGPRLVVHDVMRAYLKACRTTTQQARAHQRLTGAAAALLPAGAERRPVPWWLLPSDAGYLWRYLPYHLYQAGQAGELTALVCDLRWVEAKTRLSGSAAAVEADLDLADTPTATTLRQALGQAASLLGPIEPPAALGATLACWLQAVPGLQALVGVYRATLSRPLLEPAWPLPGQPGPDPSAINVGHTGAVTSCAFSPDSALLATTGVDGTIRLWHVADRTERAVLTGHTGGVWSCAFSPDGGLLASTGNDRTARLWEVSTGTQVAVLSGHTGWVTHCAFSPDGTLVATTSDDGTARLWDVASGTQRTILNGHTGRIWSCSFSPDGTLLATAGNDQSVRLWQVGDGTEHQLLTGHTRGAWGCAFSPGNGLLATGDDDGMVHIWRIADGTGHRLLPGLSNRVWTCVFSPDGTLLAATSFRQVRLWKVATGTEAGVLAGLSSWVWHCAFSPDGALLATGSNEGTVRLWQVATGAEVAVLTGRATHVNSCAFSPDGLLLATGQEDGALQLRQVVDGNLRHTWIGHGNRIRGLAFSPDSALLATGSNDGTVRLWQVADGTAFAVLAAHGGVVFCCAFSPDGTVLAAGTERLVRLWQVADGTQRQVLTGHTGLVRSCAFSPDGTLLATVSTDRIARLWRIADGTTAATLTGHTDVINHCAFSPDGGLLATASDDGTLRLWNIPAGTAHSVLAGHTSWVEWSSFSPDGTLLATAGHEGTVRLWQILTGRCVSTLRLAGSLAGITWHPGGTLLCTVGGAGTYMLAYRP